MTPAEELAKVREELKGYHAMDHEWEFCTGNVNGDAPGELGEPSGLVIPQQSLAAAVTAAEMNERIAYERLVTYGPWRAVGPRDSSTSDRAARPHPPIGDSHARADR